MRRWHKIRQPADMSRGAKILVLGFGVCTPSVWRSTVEPLAGVANLDFAFGRTDHPVLFSSGVVSIHARTRRATHSSQPKQQSEGDTGNDPAKFHGSVSKTRLSGWPTRPWGDDWLSEKQVNTEAGLLKRPSLRGGATQRGQRHPGEHRVYRRRGNRCRRLYHPW